ncbi:RNA ligase family protein [Clostridium sp. YIM B02555]|uniref:RNA ligase family protein n=1 Tax=Clostridium sp. YIM B02555 TaxID=2911968 RepID=UPI001EEDC76D|nr:RNA ligase family protein [Clostridium sp. YIM B02555]
MRKIKTIFKRDLKTRKVLDSFDVEFNFKDAIATEKLDGTNVRLTLRNETCVRVEKRRNPTKEQKKLGIIEPWYVDCEEAPENKWIIDAVKNTSFIGVADGEYSGEALGKSIQGNPLNLEGHTVFLFTVPSKLERIVFDDVPTTYNELKEWLPKQKSKFGNNCGIEGIVWHNLINGDMVKIKLKDF